MAFDFLGRDLFFVDMVHLSFLGRLPDHTDRKRRAFDADRRINAYRMDRAAHIRFCDAYSIHDLLRGFLRIEFSPSRLWCSIPWASELQSEKEIRLGKRIHHKHHWRRARHCFELIDFSVSNSYAPTETAFFNAPLFFSTVMPEQTIQPMSCYEVLSLIVQVIFIGVAAATCIVYYYQLRVMSNQLSAMQESSKAQSSLQLITFLQSSEVRTARQIVRETLSQKDVSHWTADERKSASLVVANFDVASALIRSGLAPADLITTNWGPSIKHCFLILKPFIDEHREKPGGSPTYWANFEWLSTQCS